LPLLTKSVATSHVGEDVVGCFPDVSGPASVEFRPGDADLYSVDGVQLPATIVFDPAEEGTECREQAAGSATLLLGDEWYLTRGVACDDIRPILTVE
jgi:hypothetical protein